MRRWIWLRGSVGVVLIAVGAVTGAEPRDAALQPIAITTTAATAAATGVPHTLAVSVSGSNGVGTTVTPGLPCGQGGQGSYHHELFDTDLTPGTVANLPAKLRANLDVHHDGVEPPVGPAVGGAFLLGDASHATLSNQRGAVQLRLTSGTCEKPPLPFDGTTVGPDGGTWAIDPTSPINSGAYRQATGSGTFTVTAGVGPGADNPWTFGLNGSLTVLEPSLAVTVASTYWGNLGLDYAARKVSVTYKITNAGPGDGFAVTVDSTSSPTTGVTALGPTPQTIGDLAAGQSAYVTVRYRLGLIGPCAAVILGCQFDTTVGATLPDALDVPVTAAAAARVTAPNVPPPA